MKEVRVLHLLSSTKYSGAENVVCQIINMYKEESYSMTYCSVNGPIKEQVEQRNIEFQGIDRFNYKNIKTIVKKVKPDIIHAHDLKASILASLFSRNIQIISHIHANHATMDKYSIKSILYRLVSDKFSHIFWVSESALKQYKFYKHVTKKSSVLYNVINIEELIKNMDNDSNKYDYDVAYLGRLVYQKNPERLIRIFKMVSDVIPKVKFVIIGDGDLRKDAEELSKKLGIYDSIDFLGFQSNPFKILNDSKVMVMSSRFEGTPMCALEAMSLGVPIVSTPTDGLKEVVDHGITGYLSDDDKIIASYICKILQDENIRNTLKINSKIKALKINDLYNYKYTIEKVYCN